jgi:hypothetical protein
MSRDSDREWQLQMTSLIAEVKTNQENLHTTLNNYCDATNKRLEKMEHIVIGNGKPGLSEEVRSLKGKWAAIYGLCLLLASAGLNYYVESSIYNRHATTEAAARQLDITAAASAAELR